MYSCLIGTFGAVPEKLYGYVAIIGAKMALSL